MAISIAREAPSRELPTDVLLRLGQQRSQARLIRFEEQSVPETTFADLDESLWRRFLGVHSTDEVTTLHKMKLLTKEEDGHERVTVAGILLCSRSPERWLPGGYIEAVRYRGMKRDSNYQIDGKRISGPLDQQIREAVAFARRNMAVYAVKQPGRVEIPQYSGRAVFEAVVNAVAHRDYSIHGSKIRLFLFDDRLELYSPGPLPNTVTIESMPLRQSTRNELITSLLARCPVEDPTGDVGRQFYMEKRGEGVPIILEESRKLSGRDPVYLLIDDAELLLTIYAAPAPQGEAERT